MTASFRPGLGFIQRKALGRLAVSQQGLTTACLADLSAGADEGNRRKAAWNALNRMHGRGLVEVAGSIPAVSRDGSGARSRLWVITDAGRKLLEQGGRSS